jgi:DNA polymerase I-like protein with 3'-5' exonuclease and polymerase domains
MDDLSEHYLGYTTTHFTDIAGKGKKQITFNQVSIDDGAPYACEDVIVTHKLNEVLAQELVNYAKLYKLYQTIELPLIAVLVTMERNGVELDENALGYNNIFTSIRSTVINTHLIEGDLLFAFACNISKMGSGELVNYATLYKLYQTLELPLIAVLVTMERNGVELDANALGSKMGSGVP